MKLHVRRGEIYYADLNPVIGSEQGGIRPVLVIQNDTGNQYSPTVVVVALSGKLKKPAQPTHCSLSAENGLEMPSQALLEHIRTIDKSRISQYVGCLNGRKMEEIDRALAASLGLSV